MRIGGSQWSQCRRFARQYALLHNILHCQSPSFFLTNSYLILELFPPELHHSILVISSSSTLLAIRLLASQIVAVNRLERLTPLANTSYSHARNHANVSNNMQIRRIQQSHYHLLHS